VARFVTAARKGSGSNDNANRCNSSLEGDENARGDAMAQPITADAPALVRSRREPTLEDLKMIERTRAARDLFSSKWKVDLLYLLARGIRRYSRLYDNLRGASKKMLTDSLRSLERDGLVQRRVYAEVPARVEYSLTTLGWSATELLIALADWADEHCGEVDVARRRYEEARIGGGPADFDGFEAA
jgi:DNA-binding HxlR family transcriptional regulator